MIPMETSHCVTFVQPGVAALQELPVPQINENQLLIRSRVTLISPGTERAFLLGLPNTSQVFPQRAGYSAIGEVVQVGSNVSGWQIGERVVCKSNHATFAAVDSDLCLRVPDELEDEKAVFFQLISIAMQGVRKARIEMGEPVAVMGAGLIGLFALQLARINGALPAVSLDLDETRLAFASTVGADVALDVRDTELQRQLEQVCHQKGASVVIEATGHPDAVSTAFDLAREGGRVVLLGSTRGETEMVNFYRDVHKKGLIILGAHESARPQIDSAPGRWTIKDDHKVCLRYLAAGRILVEPFITHRYPWHQAVDAYELLKTWDKTTLGMILDWRES